MHIVSFRKGIQSSGHIQLRETSSEEKGRRAFFDYSKKHFEQLLFPLASSKEGH